MGMVQAPDHTSADRLDRMVQLYEQDLLRLCCLCLRDRNTAEDIVQETFLKAYRNMDSFRGESNGGERLPDLAGEDFFKDGHIRFVFPLIQRRDRNFKTCDRISDMIGITAADQRRKAFIMIQPPACAV